MKSRVCKECGAAFESRRYRATCSSSCAKARRRRQYREASARRQSDPETRAHIVNLRNNRRTPEQRARHAAAERKRRQEATEEERARLRAQRRDRYADNPGVREAQRVAGQRWLAGMSPARRAERAERARERLTDPAKRTAHRAANREYARRARAEQRERELLRTLAELTEIADEPERD